MNLISRLRRGSPKKALGGLGLSCPAAVEPVVRLEQELGAELGAHGCRIDPAGRLVFVARGAV